jgi:hypothetical protein
MRLFKTNQPYPSEADRARDLRLTYIASRYRPNPESDQAEPTLDLQLPPVPQAPAGPDAEGAPQ